MGYPQGGVGAGGVIFNLAVTCSGQLSRSRLGRLGPTPPENARLRLDLTVSLRLRFGWNQTSESTTRIQAEPSTRLVLSTGSAFRRDYDSDSLALGAIRPGLDSDMPVTLAAQ